MDEKANFREGTDVKVNKKISHPFSLFWKCLLGSASVHAAVLIFLVQRPVWLSALWQTALGKIPSRSVDLSIDDDSILLDPDTTFDVIFTKKPDAKPYDLPQGSGEVLEIVKPREEYVTSPLSWSDPLSSPSEVEWATAHLPSISLVEPISSEALANLPVPLSEISDHTTIEAPVVLFAMPITPAQLEDTSNVAVAASFEEKRNLSTIGNEQHFAVDPISTQSHCEPPSFSLPPNNLEEKTLELPALALPIFATSEQPSYATLLPETQAALAYGESPEMPFLVSPLHEHVASIAIASTTPFPCPAEKTSPSAAMPKPRLSASSIPADEMLSLAPNYQFGNQLTPGPIRSYGLPELPDVSEWHDLFTFDVRMMPRKKEEDFLFSIVMTPKKKAIAYALKQNFHFIIDCSRHTARHRIPIYKRAVQRALTYLEDKQNFNIYVLEKKCALFQDAPVSGTEKQLSKAKDFLDKETYKGSHRLELLDVLRKIADLPKERDELHTIVLLSDGHLAPEDRKHELHHWLRSQRGKVGLYAATVGTEAKAFGLQLFASASGGQVLTSPTHAAFNRKFAKFIMDLQHPIATDVSLAIRSKSSQSSLSLASSDMLPPLFAGQSYTFIGSAQQPEDFTFFLEAKTKDRFIEISKHLSLKAAPQPPSSLRTLWLERMAHGELEQFLVKGSEEHIQAAKKLLSQADAQ